jgi:FKBP-type peptidyl-prolyl cis-trans isomerase
MNKKPVDYTEANIMEANRGLVDIENEYIRQYVDSMKLDLDTTNIGIRYKILASNPSGAKAKNQQGVKITYSLRAFDAAEFCSNYTDRTEIVTIGTGDIPRGMDEAVLMLHQGETGEFIIPSYLAYGIVGKGQCIASRTPIYCRITLMVVDIQKK